MSYTKNWVFTKNVSQFSVHAEPNFEPNQMKYIIYGKEYAQTGQKHYQGFVQFYGKKRMAFVNRMLGGELSVFPMKGTSVQARDYCKKDGDWEEFGEFTDTRGATAGKKETRREMYKAIKSGSKSIAELIDEEPQDVQFIKLLGEFVPARQEAAKVLYLYGETGKGKTYSTQKMCKALGYTYWKKPPGHKWFDGYQHQDVLILEEFTSCFSCTKFLTLCDPEPPAQEIKGGHVNITSNLIIICSNIHPDDQYPEVTPARRAAYLRRLTHVVCVNDMDFQEVEAVIHMFFDENLHTESADSMDVSPFTPPGTVEIDSDSEDL